MSLSNAPRAASDDANTESMSLDQSHRTHQTVNDSTADAISIHSKLEFADDDLDADFKPGMMNEISELYRDDSECDWDEWTPEAMGKEDASDSDKAALIVYRQKKGRGNTLFLRSLKIQSPLLRGILDTVFEDYDGISTTLKELVHDAPFHEYYYRWQLFERAYKEETDEETKRHLELLYPIISKEILPHINAMEDYTRNGVITFDYLWAIFPPGTCIYSKTEDHDRMYEVTTTSYLNDAYNKPYFHIDCRYVDCDGTGFGYVLDSLDIDNFSAVKKIASLKVVPMHLHPDSESMLGRLHARGEKFEAHAGYKHVLYTGFYSTPNAQRKRRQAEKGRVIIDRKMYDIYVNGYETTLLELNPKSEEDGSDDSTEGVPNIMSKASAFKDFQETLKRYDAESSTKDSSKQEPGATPVSSCRSLTLIRRGSHCKTANALHARAQGLLPDFQGVV